MLCGLLMIGCSFSVNKIHSTPLCCKLCRYFAMWISNCCVFISFIVNFRIFVHVVIINYSFCSTWIFILPRVCRMIFFLLLFRTICKMQSEYDYKHCKYNATYLRRKRKRERKAKNANKILNSGEKEALVAHQQSQMVCLNLDRCKNKRRQINVNDMKSVYRKT